MLRVHLKGHFCLAHHAAEHWRDESKAGRQPDARIINTSSGAGLQGSVGQSAYSAAKAGIAALTLVQAAELGALRRDRERDRALRAHAHDRGRVRRPMKAPESGFDAMEPANIVAARRLARQRRVEGRHRPGVRDRGRRALARRRLAHGPAPRQGRALGARRGRRRGRGPDRRRRCRRRRCTEPRELRVHRGAGGAARHGARLPRRALEPEQVRAAMESELGYDPSVWKRIGARARLDGRRDPRGATAGSGSAWVELVALLEVMGEALLLRAVLRDRRASPRSALLGGGRRRAAGRVARPHRRRGRDRGARLAARRRARPALARAAGATAATTCSTAPCATSSTATAPSCSWSRRAGRARASSLFAVPGDARGPRARALPTAGPHAPARRAALRRRARARERAARRRRRGAAPRSSARSRSAPSRSPPSRSAARSAASTSPSPTRRSACSSGARSAPSRPSSTSAPT